MSESRRFYLEIFLISFAALILEISYTRLISFKLFYYYTYLIIGFALLGIGSGGVFVAISRRLRTVDLETLLASCSVAGAAAVIAGYLVVAWTPIDTGAIWDLSAPAGNIARLLLLCLALFSNFIFVGIMIAALFGRMPRSINRLYFADLIGAGAACAVVVPAIDLLGPPSAIFLGGFVLALVGARLAFRKSRPLLFAAVATSVPLAVGAVAPAVLPAPETDALKSITPGTDTLFSQWSSVFRVDVTASGNPDMRVIHHDGLWGSSLHRWDGRKSSLGRFERDERSFPFRVLGEAPEQVLIIGAAGGHEILSSLYFSAGEVTAVELNPLTVSLLTTVFPDYSGRLHENSAVDIVNDEGRSFLARSEEQYDLILFVAPDSYSAQAAAGAFVLSESYLYTAEMIVESLEHLTDDGIISMQFGEFSYDRKPNRTGRYVGTARRALEQLGVQDPGRHVLVATSPSIIPISTILVKKTPFSPAEIQRFVDNIRLVPGSQGRYAPGRQLEEGVVDRILTLDRPALEAWYDAYAYDIAPISDDSPFFWHFARFRTVIAEFATPLGRVDTEDSVGERVLLLMVAISILFASVFLMLPFIAIRDVWSALPHKRASAGYFACLGLGFMFFEISLIQNLTLFLGYPTYSLTITLMGMLIFTGLGSLAAGAYVSRRDQALPFLLCAVAVLTLFYQFGMQHVTALLLGAPLAVRAVVTILCIAPLGLCLGAFMPLGLATVSALTHHRDEYVAWGWAVNGFFSVIGSVLTTILSMVLGFRMVLLLGLAVYAIAVLLLRRIPRPA